MPIRHACPPLAARAAATLRPVLPFAGMAALGVALGACATLGGRHRPDGSASPAGEWVDVAKTTPADTMVWVLAPNGGDALFTIHAGPPRRTTRQRFGRWSLGRTAGGAPALCVVRRPGRDARSCAAFTLDSAIADGAPVRRLVVRGYAGTHHRADRVLLERRRPPTAAPPPAPPPPPAPNASPASAANDAPGGGGYHPRAVQPERPSVATHAGTVAPGYAELETGGERDRAGDGTRAALVPSVLKFGVTPRTQLTLTLPAQGATGTPFGPGDIAAGLKWRVSQNRPRVQDVAVLPQLKLPTGGARGTGTTDLSLLLINSRTLGPASLDLNVGATWRTGDGTRAPRTATLWTAAAGIPVLGALGLALECYGYPGTAGPAGSPPIVALLTGPTFVVRPELAVDAGVIVPIAGPQPRALYVGLVTSLGRFPAATTLRR